MVADLYRSLVVAWLMTTLPFVTGLLIIPLPNPIIMDCLEDTSLK